MSSYSSEDDEYDADEPPELQLNVRKLIDRATKTFNTTCTSATRMTRGAAHEVYLLRFEKGNENPHESLARAEYTCIARFARVKGDSAKDESEVATIRYLKQHTSLPVPEIYDQDLDPDNEVGAAFVLMERLPGRPLHRSWDGLTLDDKKRVLSQIASVIVQLGSLRFDRIGCLTADGIGPIINDCYKSPQGPFNSTLDYLQSFVSVDSVESPKLAHLFGQIHAELANFMSGSNGPYHEPPFAMIHADFDAQNMLFVDSPDGSGLKFSGLIDFEYAHTGPAYFLYEFPIFIQDVEWSPELYADNVILRTHFVSEIYHHLPSPEARRTFITCMNSKNFLLNRFHDAFMRLRCTEEMLSSFAFSYLRKVRDQTGPAYSGRTDYTPERYSETGQLVSNTTSVPERRRLVLQRMRRFWDRLWGWAF